MPDPTRNAPSLRDGEVSTTRPRIRRSSIARLGEIVARALVAIAVALAAAGCTCEGCRETFRWSAQLPLDVEIRSLSIRACHNGRCVEASLAEVDGDGVLRGRTVFVGLTDPAAPDASGAALLMLSRTPDALDLELSWTVPDPVDGDRYLVEVAGAGGAILAGLAEQPIDYDTYAVNSPFTHCQTTSVTGSTIDASLPDASGSP